MLGREMPERQRTYTAEHTIAAPPWEVYDLLVDPEQQGQWRERFEPHGEVIEDAAYTHVRFEGGLLMELEPEGTGTRVRSTRVRTGEGLTGAIGLVFQSRKRMEEDLQDQLKRVGASVEFGAI